MNPPKFTPEQVDWICYQIGEWYLDWKHMIVDTGVCHRLGVAKESLKARICPEYPKEEENEGPAD